MSKEEKRKIDLSIDIVKNNEDEKANLLSKYDKYKSAFDISISKDTVILKPKNIR